jgi:hypothetical protein
VGYWEDFVKETEELELENKLRTEKIVNEAKERNKKAEKEWEDLNKYSVRVSRCYLVQVMDESGNEVASEYSFASTKKEAEEKGYKMRADIVRRN